MAQRRRSTVLVALIQQNAIEHAVITNFIPLTGHLTHDVVIVMRNYDRIIENYRTAQSASTPLLEATLNFAAQAGLPVTEVAQHFQRAA